MNPASRTIDIEQAVLSDNAGPADKLRADLTASTTFAPDVMASPGAGKTTLLLATLARLSAQGIRAGVIEGDREPTIHSPKMAPWASGRSSCGLAVPVTWTNSQQLAGVHLHR